MIEYTLIRTKRKTAAIYVRDGGVEVRAPLRLPRREIDRFVISKEDWIMKRLSLSAERAENRASFFLDYGSKILIWGNEYPLLSSSDGSRSAEFGGEAVYLPPGLTREQIKYACVELYRRLAKTHLHKRVSHFVERMGDLPSSVKINGAKTRWGSCSAKKRINFSWRLITADESVIDYVVVHELAHLTEMNHSVRFWAIVCRILPDFKERGKQLKLLQQRLSAENWDCQ